METHRIAVFIMCVPEIGRFYIARKHGLDRFFLLKNNIYGRPLGNIKHESVEQIVCNLFSMAL